MAAVRAAGARGDKTAEMPAGIRAAIRMVVIRTAVTGIQIRSSSITVSSIRITEADMEEILTTAAVTAVQEISAVISGVQTHYVNVWEEIFVHASKEQENRICGNDGSRNSVMHDGRQYLCC